MELSFQLLDCDYIYTDTPIVRLFGKTKDNKTVCVFCKNYQPYFYVLPKKDSEGKLVTFLKDNFQQQVTSVEEVEKFLPVGVQQHKTKLIKITLRDPSETPKIRDRLLEEKFIEKIFEADILFKYRYMADHNISGMRWYTVTGSGSLTNVVKTDRKVDASSIKESKEEENAPLRYMGIDIEIASSGDKLPDYKKDPISIISLAFHPNFKGKNSLVLVAKPIKKGATDVKTFKTEREMLEEFVKIVDTFDPDVIVGYNINNFDMPYILGRFEENKIPKTIGRCKQKPAIIKKFGNKTRCNITGRIVADVYLLVKESVGKGLLRLKRYGLGDVAKELINESKIDIAHSEIGKFWNGSEDQINKLIEYGRKDAELVLKILLSRDMLGKFIELSKISGVLLQDALDGGEATRVENLLLREFNKLDFVIPNKPTSKEIMRMLDERETRGLKGALVLEPEIGLHTNCVVYLDFKALYPSIFISYNICPTTLVLDKQTKLETIDTPIGVKFVSPKIKQGVFPRIIEQLIKERDKVKKEMRSASEQDKKILDAKQNALKIMANAFYGYTGYIRARFYILDIANAITSCGRNLIQETKKIVESDTRLKVIYGDTDSLMVKLQTTDLDEALKLGMEIEDNINKKLLGKVTMKIESIFKTLLVLTKKRYAGLSCEKVNGEWKEKILMKGIETIRRDWCDLTSKTLFNVLNVLLREQDVKKALSYVKDVLGKLERNEVPVEDLIVTKSISKPLKDYKGVQPHIELVKKMRQRYPASAPGIGDRVEFVIVKGTQLMSARAEDPEYVKKHGLKIDSRYYIESQVLPPLERVFEAIGIGKQELMTVGKQLILTEAIRNGLKKPMENEPLKKIDGFICSKCDTTYRRIPLIGKCTKCDGEILFYSGEMRSRYFTM